MIPNGNDARELTAKLRRRALGIGFDLFGVARIERKPELTYLDTWLQRGYAGSMHWLRKQKEKRQDPALIVPEAKSVIVCATNYHTDAPLSAQTQKKESAWISRYAWGDDYHKTLKKNIKTLHEFLVAEGGEGVVGRYYVDTGPVSEKVWAQYAGLGWIGKNTCLINRRIGSFTFLSVIITNRELSYDAPGFDHCGSCTRCIDACPTDALVQPYVLDARRCISYLTIEHRDAIPEDRRAEMGRHIYGCDICQDVCPWNRKAPFSDKTSFLPREANLNPRIENILTMNNDDFREQFKQSPVKRTKLRGLLRNALVAAGNSGLKRLGVFAKRHFQSEDEMIREHARWAYEKLKTIHSSKSDIV